jgi:putative DNA primase/helicase
MFILIGNGSNGKNVLLDTFKAIGGDYVETIAPEVLMAAKFDNGADQASPSTRKLAGARAAISSESKEGQRLDVSVVKRHTGGGFITARGLHESPATFAITHKLLLMTNSEPSVDHMDDATRGRLHMIPFDMQWNRPSTTNPDPNLPDAQKDLMDVLAKEHEGILLWLVQGAVAYAGEGLPPPNEVVARTQSYLDSQDTFKQWIAGYETCAPNDGDTAGSLYDQYCQLCRAEALPREIASAAALGKRLKASGYENLKARDGMKYGLRKKNLVDDPPAADLKVFLASWDADMTSGDGAPGQCVTV